MPIAAGDFSASELAQAIITADKMWADDMVNADYKANTGVYDAIKAEQNAKLELVQDGEKDRDVKITWINACGSEVEDADDDCKIGGDEAHSDSKTYALGQNKKYGFTVDEKVWRTNNHNMAEAVAVNLLRADKILSEYICRGMVAKIEAFKGVNQVNNGIGSVNGATGNTDIAASDWNENLFAYLYRIAIQNEFSNPFLLSGTNLFEDRFLALQNAANGEGKGTSKLFQSIRSYFDLFNIDPVSSPELKTYLINRGSMAFASKVYYGKQPVTYVGAGQQRYSIASRNLAGLEFDVVYTNRCTNNTMKHDWTIYAKYDVFKNPTGCNGERTGVIAFNKV